MSDPLDAALDRAPLSQLSRRQLLERIARTQERMEQLMSQAQEYLRQALDGLDAQWRSLVERVTALADEVRDAQGDEAAMTAAADKLTALATQAGQLALPSEVADPDNPAEAGPLDPGATPDPVDPVDQDASVDPETGQPAGDPVPDGTEPAAETPPPTGVY